MQAGPMILDNRGRVVWFLPLDTHGVTDFRMQRYHRLLARVKPGHGLLGDIHEFQVTPRNAALMTISRHVRVKGRKVLEGGVQELDFRTGRVLFEWHSIDHVQLVESYYHLPRRSTELRFG